MSSLAEHTTSYDVVEAEPPELQGRNLKVGAQLLAGATCFSFLGFLFSYFYLRSLNNGHMWRPAHVDPSQTLGVLITLALVGSLVLVRVGLENQRSGRGAGWRLKGSLGLALGVLAVALQAAAWLTQGFGPASGGYASVYVGWTSFFVVFALGGLFWLETLVATSWRYRKVAPEPGHASGDPHRSAHDIADPLATIRPGIEAFSLFWAFLVGIGVLMWVVLYLV